MTIIQPWVVLELKEKLAKSEARICELEAEKQSLQQANAAMREAMRICVSLREKRDMTEAERQTWNDALATDAGKPLLARLAAAERLIAAWQAPDESLLLIGDLTAAWQATLPTASPPGS